jgi:formate dehydrogenase major subunit
VFPSDGRKAQQMALRELLDWWPVVRQIRDRDLAGKGATAKSARTEAITPRTAEADGVTRSICPFCAVGCGQLIYHRDGRVTQVEGDPDSPISRGRLCARGSSTKELVTGEAREYTVKYRAPHATEWQELALEDAMAMIADRVVATRAATWQDRTEDGHPANRTLGIAHLGGATLDNEENYLLKKLLTGGLGIVTVENQARI